MTTQPKLTAVLHALVKKAPSGLDAETIAALLGYSRYSTMMSELSDQPGHKLGANMVLPIMDAAGSDEPLHFLARQRGGVFIKLPQALAGQNPVQVEAMRAVKEFGELMGELGERLGDGSISAQDRVVITREGHEAVTAIMGLLKLVAESAEGRA